MADTASLDTIASLAKRRGFVFPASDIYGGLAGFWDYGPYGTEMANNIKILWWDKYVRQQPNIFGVDGSIIQNPKLWEASGHVSGFIDPLVDCKSCKTRHRADHIAGKDTTNLEDLTKILEGAKCPNCGKADLTLPRNFNLMLKTSIGAVEDESSVAYLRPETAGSIFTNFELVRESTRSKIPFGIAQIGKAFRNEINPREFIFRVRELEQMEMQYFIHSNEQIKEYQAWRDYNWEFLTKTIGLSENRLKWHEHDDDERAHYAAVAHDIQFKFPMGFKELMGTHNRTDFDLKSHMEHSGKDLQYFDTVNDEHFIPYVIESSFGVGRLFMAALIDAYHEEVVKGETRVVLKLAPALAPVDVAVLPLSKNDQVTPLAQEVFKLLVENTSLNVEYDETQSIGKRYRRQDEIGTPQCITIDFDSLKDKSVTIRDRDTMEQKRVAIDKLVLALS